MGANALEKPFSHTKWIKHSTLLCGGGVLCVERVSESLWRCPICYFKFFLVLSQQLCVVANVKPKVSTLWCFFCPARAAGLHKYMFYDVHLLSGIMRVVWSWPFDVRKYSLCAARWAILSCVTLHTENICTHWERRIVFANQQLLTLNDGTMIYPCKLFQGTFQQTSQLVYFPNTSVWIRYNKLPKKLDQLLFPFSGNICYKGGHNLLFLYMHLKKLPIIKEH